MTNKKTYFAPPTPAGTKLKDAVDRWDDDDKAERCRQRQRAQAEDLEHKLRQFRRSKFSE